MEVLGLDLASRVTGWCCGDGYTVPTCDVWAFQGVTTDDGADYGLLLSQLKAYLDAIFVRYPGIGAVGYESPILITRGRKGRATDSLSKLRLLYPLGAFTEYLCRDVYKVPCHEIGVQEAKKEVTGNGNAEKEDVARIAEKCGVVLPKVGRLDAGDAWSVWKRLLRHYNPRASEQWDARIHGPRRASLL